MSSKSMKASLLAGLLVLSLIAPVRAQQVSVNTGAIQGKITDPNGAVIQGATVVLTNASLGLRREAKVFNDGTFIFPLVQPSGGYQVEIEAQGFRRHVIQDLTVRVTETTDASAQLALGAVSEEVIVAAGVATVQTTSATLGGTLERKVVSSLPIIDRNPLQLLATDSGVVNTPGSTTLFVNGNRSTYNNYQLNGADANNFEFGSLSSVATPNPDSIQEFRTQTSLFDATMGRGAGANITVVSRSGTSSIHGNLLYLNRNSALAANSFFLNAQGLPRPRLNRNHFGGSVGGPFPGGKTFWFFNYEGARQRNPAEVNAFFPVLPASRNSASIAAAFALQPSQIDPVAVAILNLSGPYQGKLFPDVNGPLGTFQRFSTSATNIRDEDQFTARVDHEYRFWGREHRVAGTVFWSRANTLSPLTFGQGSAFDINNPVYTIQNTTIFNPRLLNELTLGANVGVRDGNNHVNAHTLDEIGMSKFNSSAFPELPSFAFLDGSAPSFGTPTNPGPDQHTNSVTVRDIISYQRGRHSMRFGADIRWYQFNYDQAFAAHGLLQFLNFNSFLTGTPLVRFIGSGTSDRAFRAHDIVPFFQDDWRVTNRLTLNLGLRYDYMAAIYEKYNRNGNFDPARVSPEAARTGGAGILAGYIFPEELPGFGTPGVPRHTLKGEDRNNWAPRISFAYDVFGTGKMAVRGGYGLFYTRIAAIPALQLTSQPPFSLLSSEVGFFGDGILSNPFPNLPGPEAFPILPAPPTITGFAANGTPIFNGPLLSITAFDQNLRTPYVHNWNLTAQYELFRNWIVEVGYVGSRGLKLYSTQSINNALLRNENNPGAMGVTTNSSANRNARVPFIGFGPGGVTMIGSNANSIYHSGQVTVTHQFAQGFYVKGAYTWSKSIDNNSAQSDFDIGGSPGNQFFLDLNRGVSNHDIPHRFVLTYVWDIPGPRNKYLNAVAGGWTTSGILTYQNGFPFNVSQNAGLTTLSGTSGLANYIAGCNPYPNNRGIDNFLNPACFAPTPVLTGGTQFGPLSPFETAGDQFYTISPNGSGQLMGNLGRNAFRGPNQFRWDAGIHKKFFIRALGELTNVELRAELFNVLNHPVFGNPAATADFPASFGRIFGTANISRQTQIQLKFNF